MISIFKEIIAYKDLVRELVSKDIKLKYRRSFLGYLWSILNPLGIMLVMVIVFSNMFRWDIAYYPVYLIVGQVMFNYMSATTTHSLYSILDNGALLKKVYVPKYIFTFSKVTSDLTDFFFSMGASLVVMIVTSDLTDFFFFNGCHFTCYDCYKDTIFMVFATGSVRDIGIVLLLLGTWVVAGSGISVF